MKNLLEGKKIVQNFKKWIIVPIAIVVIAMIVFGITAAVKGSFKEGINIGIDFEGGSMLTVTLGSELAVDKYDENLDKISDIIKNNGGEISYSQKSSEGSTAAIVVKYNALSTEANTAIQEEVRAAYPSVTIENFVALKTIGPTASANLINTAILSVVVAMVLILIYVIIRFEFFSGCSAVIALMHDVLMMFALTIIFQIQINSSFIAAMITIVSYSINNTIVIFDRIRENDKSNKTMLKPLPTADIVNKSVVQTLARSVNTSLTTLCAIVLLAVIGVSSIREFAFPVIFGLIMGTYSSIFLSPSLYVLMKNANDRRLSKKPVEKRPSTQTQKVKTAK